MALVDHGEIARVTLSGGRWADVHAVAAAVLQAARDRRTHIGLNKVRNAVDAVGALPTSRTSKSLPPAPSSSATTSSVTTI